MTIGTAGLEDPRGAAVTVWNYSLRRGSVLNQLNYVPTAKIND